MPPAGHIEESRTDCPCMKRATFTGTFGHKMQWKIHKRAFSYKKSLKINNCSPFTSKKPLYLRKEQVHSEGGSHIATQHHINTVAQSADLLWVS